MIKIQLEMKWNSELNESYVMQLDNFLSDLSRQEQTWRDSLCIVWYLVSFMSGHCLGVLLSVFNLGLKNAENLLLQMVKLVFLVLLDHT